MDYDTRVLFKMYVQNDDGEFERFVMTYFHPSVAKKALIALKENSERYNGVMYRITDRTHPQLEHMFGVRNVPEYFYGFEMYISQSDDLETTVIDW